MADNNKLPIAFLDSGFAQWYIANAAPGKPNIININSPVKYLVASLLKWTVLGSANCAKKIFWPPCTKTPSTTIDPPIAVCQNGR